MNYIIRKYSFCIMLAASVLVFVDSILPCYLHFKTFQEQSEKDTKEQKEGQEEELKETADKDEKYKSSPHSLQYTGIEKNIANYIFNNNFIGFTSNEIESPPPELV